MIEDIVSAFQSKQDVFLTREKASDILHALKFIIDEDEVRDGRVSRIPFRLASGDAIGDYFFIALSPLDCSISLALDDRSSMSYTLAMNMARIFKLTKKNLLICKIKKDNLNYENYKSIALISDGIPNFRARCVSIIARQESEYKEIKRFVNTRNFNIEVHRYRDEDFSSAHKFSFSIEGESIVVESSNIQYAIKGLNKYSSKSLDIGIDPVKMANSLISVDIKDEDHSIMRRYFRGGNKDVNVGSKVVAKPTNFLKSKCIGTVVGKDRNIIKVQWDSGDVFYNLDNPKTYFLIEIID